jgi:DNA gyrase subunit A
MLVTDAGRLIRVPADQVRLTGRSAMGVTVFRVDAGEHVTSLFPVVESDAADDPAGDPPGPEADGTGEEPS